MSKNISRRSFLGAAAAAGASAVAAPAFAASSNSSAPAKWDDEVDVVVLGCGGAGMMAACQAHDAGGKVAVYDAGKSPFHTAINLCGGLFTAWVQSSRMLTRKAKKTLGSNLPKTLWLMVTT